MKRVLVVLVGRNVACAFGAGSVAYFEEFLLGRISAVSSHTSFRITWLSPDEPARTVLHTDRILSAGKVGGPSYIEIKYTPAMVIPCHE